MNMMTDQRQWDYDTAANKTMGDVALYPELADGEKFEIEKNAAAVRLDDGSAVIPGNDWSRRRLAYSPLSLKGGGTKETGECAYNYTQLAANATKGTRVRLGLRFRGTASSSIACPRLWLGNYAVSNSTYRVYGCSAQALIGT